MCLSHVCENHFDNPINHIPFIRDKYRPRLVQFLRRHFAYRNFDRLPLGYKVLTKLSLPNVFGFPCCDHYIPRYMIGQWYKADEVLVLATDNTLYRSGFHIFLSEEAAKEWMFSDASNIDAIAKVEFRDITSIGYQQSRPCIIARYIKVLGFLD